MGARFLCIRRRDLPQGNHIWGDCGGNLTVDMPDPESGNASAHGGDWKVVEAQTTWLRANGTVPGQDGAAPFYMYGGFNIVHPPCEPRHPHALPARGTRLRAGGICLAGSSARSPPRGWAVPRPPVDRERPGRARASLSSALSDVRAFPPCVRPRPVFLVAPGLALSAAQTVRTRPTSIASTSPRSTCRSGLRRSRTCTPATCRSAAEPR